MSESVGFGGTTGGINASIPLAAGRGVVQPKPFNPLESYSQFANIQNALNTARLFPTVQQRQETALQGEQLALRQSQASAATNYLTPFFGKDFVSHDDVLRGLGNGTVLGMPTDPMIASLANYPVPKDGNYKSFIRENVIPTLPPAAQLAALTPTPQSYVKGGGISIGTNAPLGGEGTPGVYAEQQNLGTTLTPGEKAAPQTVFVNDQPGQVPTSSLVDDRGNALDNPLLGGLPSPTEQPPTAPVRPGAPAAPQVPPSVPLADAGAAPSQPPAPIIGAPKGFRPTAAALGQPEEIAASTSLYQQETQASSSFRQRIFPLEQAATALKGADTGPGSESVNNIKSFLLAQAPASLQKYLPGVDPTKIANYDEAVKYLANYAMQQPGAAQSDMHLGLAQVANASTHISSQAAQNVVQNALGLERMRQAAYLEFNATHPAGSAPQFGRYLSTFAAGNDPRGFSWDSQSPAQQKASIDSMTRADKERLARSVTMARRYDLTGQAGGQ